MHDMAFEVVMQSLTASCARLITGGITALDGAYALAGGRNAFSCWRAQDIWGLGFTEQAAESSTPMVHARGVCHRCDFGGPGLVM